MSRREMPTYSLGTLRAMGFIREGVWIKVIDRSKESYSGRIAKMDDRRIFIIRDDGKEGGEAPFWKPSTRNMTWIGSVPTKCSVCDRIGEFLSADGKTYCSQHIWETEKCDYCGNVYTDKAKLSNDGANGKICKSCVEKHNLVFCKWCKIPVQKDIIRESDGICSPCTERIDTCENCKKMKDIAEIRTGLDGKKYCPSCFRRYFAECIVCGTVINVGDSVSMHDGRTCRPCAENHYSRCSECRGMFRNDDMVEEMCQRCHRELMSNVISRPAQDEEIAEMSNILTEELIFPYIPKFNKFNSKDYGTKEIVEAVGEVERPIYLFGLKDRPDFHIACSRPVLQQLSDNNLVKENTSSSIPTAFMASTPIGNVGVSEQSRPDGLGLSSTLRKNHFPWCVEIVKKLSCPVTKQE